MRPEFSLRFTSIAPEDPGTWQPLFNRVRAADRAGELAHPLVELSREAEYALRVIEHELARRRQRDLAVAALEKARAEMLFELLDLERHRRLRHEKLLGRLGEAQLPGDGMKDLQSAIGHDLVRSKE